MEQTIVPGGNCLPAQLTQFTSAAVRLKMGYPTVLRGVFLFLSALQQQIESSEIRVIRYRGLHLLFLQNYELLSSTHELFHEMVSFTAKFNLGDAPSGFASVSDDTKHSVFFQWRSVHLVIHCEAQDRTH
jgi:hypothetical protein